MMKFLQSCYTCIRNRFLIKSFEFKVPPWPSATGATPGVSIDKRTSFCCKSAIYLPICFPRDCSSASSCGYGGQVKMLTLIGLEWEGSAYSVQLPS